MVFNLHTSDDYNLLHFCNKQHNSENFFALSNQMNTGHISLRSLELFLQVLKQRNISKVAKANSLSVSIVSRIIRQLETDLGQQLFYRNTRVITPTQIGLSFAEDARYIVKQFENIQRKLENIGQEPTGTVRINAPVLFGQRHITPYLEGLRKRYPKLLVELIQTDDFIDPYADGTDIIFRITSLKNSTLRHRIIAEQKHCLVASPRYIAEYGLPNSLIDLANHRSLLYRGQAGILQWLFNMGGKWQPQQIPEVLVSNNANTLIAAAATGMGILMMPDWAVYDEIRSHQLVRVLPDIPVSSQSAPIHIAMLYPQTHHISLNVRSVIDYFADIVFKEVYWQNITV